MNTFTMPAELVVRPFVGSKIPSNSTEAILERTCVEATMSQIKICLKFISNVWLQDHAAYFLNKTFITEWEK
jgi:hypothetical protein